jgi:GT2 family glycosyltransferase
MKDPFVSIIIITRNRASLLRHCIEHVLSQPYPHKEIVVVDSSSNDESEQVVTQFPEVIKVRLLGQRNNRPQAYNEGIAASSGNIIAFVDDDAMVQPSWLESLIEAYHDETVGGVGGRVIEIPWPHCDLVSGPPRMFVKPSGRVIGKDWGLFSMEKVEVDHLAGGNMSFRSEILEQVGGLDPNYTLANLRVETDLCVRVKMAGWRIMFVPSMAVVHFSARARSPFTWSRPYILFSAGRNCMYFAIKNFGLNPRTLVGQLIVDEGVDAGKLFFRAGLLIVGAMAQMVGRVVGLGVGIALLMSSQRRAAAAPKIERRINQSANRCPGTGLHSEIDTAHWLANAHHDHRSEDVANA